MRLKIASAKPALTMVWAMPVHYAEREYKYAGHDGNCGEGLEGKATAANI
jgi:hypothetical protein